MMYEMSGEYYITLKTPQIKAAFMEKEGLNKDDFSEGLTFKHDYDPSKADAIYGNLLKDIKPGDTIIDISGTKINTVFDFRYILEQNIKFRQSTAVITIKKGTVIKMEKKEQERKQKREKVEQKKQKQLESMKKEGVVQKKSAEEEITSEGIIKIGLGIAAVSFVVGGSLMLLPIAAVGMIVGVSVALLGDVIVGGLNLFVRASTRQKKRVKKPILEMIKYFKNIKDAKYDLDENNNTYTFHDKGKQNCKIVYVENSFLYIYNTDTKKPIFKSLKGSRSLDKSKHLNMNWYNKDDIGTTVSKSNPYNNIIVGFWFRNAIIYMDGVNEARIYDKGLKKFKATATMSGNWRSKDRKILKFVVTFPKEWKNKALDDASSKVETAMIEATEKFKQMGKGAKNTKKLSKFGKKYKKLTNKKEVDKAKQNAKKHGISVYDPFPFATQIRRREHKIYKNLKF